MSKKAANEHKWKVELGADRQTRKLWVATCDKCETSTSWWQSGHVAKPNVRVAERRAGECLGKS